MSALHLPPVDDSDLELLGSSSPRGTSSHHCRMTAKVSVAGVALLCLVGAVVSMTPRNVDTANVSNSVELVANTVCRDTAGWTNGHAQCNTNGYKGPGCEADGLSCEAYVANGWCAAGVPLKAWAIGASMNSPEQNCCVCGGGSSLQNSAAAAPSAVEAPAEISTSFQPKPGAPTSCAAYSECAQLELSGECCPNSDGVVLDCCTSPLTCLDTPGWTNGYSACHSHGLTEAEGCTAQGVTCAGYVNQSFCAEGHVLPGKEWSLGARFNYPEQHCCACGKPPGLNQ